ncbi:MAG: amidase [Caulobacter sp.]|nr:amidase [Caulobacter sp.]
MIDITTATAGELAAALAARKVSALELADAAIARIKAVDGAINAVVVRDFDRAIDAAKAADRALARGERGALLGVPMTVKESNAVAGLASTWGFEGFKGFVAERDATAVARLKAAGAVILGKTNVPPFLSDFQSNNAVYGRTNNPYDLTRSPGGSSGGAAAALAAGMVPLEFGSDIGGSIRVPAAFCGVFGHKPSHGLIPSRGHSPPGTDGKGIDLAVVGPLARTAADLALALDVTAGPADEEAVGYRAELPSPRHGRLDAFRVLVLDGRAIAPVDDVVSDTVLARGEALARAGAAVTHAAEAMPDPAVIQEIYLAMLDTQMTRGQPGAHSISAHEWLTLLDRQTAVRRQFTELFRDIDVILMPAFGQVAFPHNDDPDFANRTLEINGKPTRYFDQIAWAGAATLGNLPATAMPIGMTDAGLPIGCQIVGPYLEDRTTIAFAGLMEREFWGFVAPQLA